MSVLEQELNTALELVKTCGQTALAIQRGGERALAVEDKPDNQGPVTQADLAVEAKIVEVLRATFPDDAILAEEKARDAAWLERERVWMIDPVDGTRDFAEGSASWAIHIGLVIAGRPALGVVHEPGADRTSWAIDHEGERSAWTRTGEATPLALHGLGLAHQHRWRLVTSKSHRSPRLDPLAQALDITREQQLRTGSTGVKISMVARNEAEIYAHPTPGTKLWDSCAPHVILAATGGTLTTVAGEPLRYDTADIRHDHGLLATGRDTDHDAIVERLRPLANEWFGS